MNDFFYTWSIIEGTKGVELQGTAIPADSRFYFLVGAGVSADSYLSAFRGPSASASLKPLLQKNSALSISQNGGGPEVVEVWKGVLDKVQCARPTMFHEFLRLLYEKNSLGHVFTQNFDGLEVRAGVPTDKVTMLHGNVMKSRCMVCSYQIDTTCIEGEDFKPCPSCLRAPVKRGPNLARECHIKKSYLVPCIDFYESESPMIDQEQYARDCQAMLNDQSAVLIVAGTSLSNDVKGALNLVRQSMKFGVKIFWWNLNASSRTDIEFTGLYLGDIQRISLDFINQLNYK